MTPEKIKNNLLLLIIAIFVLEGALFNISNFKLNKEDRLENERIEKIKSTLDDASILAKAVSVYDFDQKKKLYAKNDEMPLPIASLTKIMTVAIGLEKHKQDSIISVPLDAIKEKGDFGLYANEKWNTMDLAKLTLISSANDGAHTFTTGYQDFLEKMNLRAYKLGARNTNFLNFTGLDLDGSPAEAGAWASAEEVNTMAIFANLAYPDVFKATTMPEINLTSISGFTHNFKNTDTILHKIPNLIFSKTGYTEVAGGNLTVIFKDKRGHKIAITVLGSTYTGRFSDMEQIVNVLYNL